MIHPYDGITFEKENERFLFLVFTADPTLEDPNEVYHIVPLGQGEDYLFRTVAALCRTKKQILFIDQEKCARDKFRSDWMEFLLRSGYDQSIMNHLCWNCSLSVPCNNTELEFRKTCIEAADTVHGDSWNDDNFVIVFNFLKDYYARQSSFFDIRRFKTRYYRVVNLWYRELDK